MSTLKDALGLVLEFVVPGIGGTIFLALDTMSSLCYEMKENEVMCRRVLERLQFVWDELQKIQDENMLRDNQVLPKFGGAINNFMTFLKKHSRKKLLSRLASSRKLAEEVQEFHTEIDFLFKLLNLVHIAEMSAWKQQWEQDQKIQRELMQQLVNNTHLISSELHGGALVEALTELKYEIEVKGQNQSPEQVALMRQTFMSVVRTSKAKVPKLAAIDIAARVPLADAIETLKELADEEEREERRLNSMRHDRLCPECQFEVPCDNVFCGRCGERLGTFRKAAAAKP
ncbi:hypothetical protein PybrP1_002052 [[Pythium] brassicae (nom. inval.)]|nr:hypothetical protein PybrP1_002052 [[Pythium] brassicae (nom. inval.)]